jgi:leader peptidase (prepilin peptidase) / N-methyltransferase
MNISPQDKLPESDSDSEPPPVAEGGEAGISEGLAPPTDLGDSPSLVVPETDELRTPDSHDAPPLGGDGRENHRTGWIRGTTLACCCLLFGFSLFYIIHPLIAHSWTEPIPEKSEMLAGLALTEELQLRGVRVFAIVWLVVLGTSVGSFLNVVVYRSPRTMTLLGSSRCPRCQHAIRSRHNIPVLGWLILEGRCHDCGHPISKRYPVVEALVGSVFLSLAVATLFSGGANLPFRPPHLHSGITWILFYPRWDLICIYLFHTSLLCVLLSWALMQWDRMRIPPPFRLTALSAILGLGWIAPDLYPIIWNSANIPFRQPSGSATGLLTAMVGGLWGSVAGWLLGAASEFGRTRRHDLGPRREFLRETESGLALVGLALGWQVISPIALLTAPAIGLAVRLRLVGRAETAALLMMFLMTWCYLLFWNPLSRLTWWPGPFHGWFFHLFCLLLACWIVRMSQRSRDFL